MLAPPGGAVALRSRPQATATEAALTVLLLAELGPDEDDQLHWEGSERGHRKDSAALRAKDPTDRNQLKADFNKSVREQNARSITRWAELEPEDLGYRAAFAPLCAGDGRGEEAEKQFRFVLERDPKLNEVRFSYANLLVQSRRFSEATAQCEAIVATAPNFLRAHNLLGLIALNLRQYTAAEKHFRRCVSIQPDYWVPLGNLGQALASQGKLDEAEKYFLEMLRLDPKDERATKFLKLIAKRRSGETVRQVEKPEAPAGW